MRPINEGRASGCDCGADHRVQSLMGAGHLVSGSGEAGAAALGQNLMRKAGKSAGRVRPPLKSTIKVSTCELCRGVRLSDRARVPVRVCSVPVREVFWYASGTPSGTPHPIASWRRFEAFSGRPRTGTRPGVLVRGVLSTPGGVLVR